MGMEKNTVLDSGYNLVDSFINGRMKAGALVFAGVVGTLQEERGVPNDGFDRCLDEEAPVLWIFIREDRDSQCGSIDLVFEGLGSLCDSLD